MNTELSKNLKCIVMRSGVEIWVEGDRAEILQGVLDKITEHKFIRYEGDTINTADITGIFGADAMEDKTRRKNGEFKCKQNEWHMRNEKCECLTPEQKASKKKYEDDYMEKYGMRPLS